MRPLAFPGALTVLPPTVQSMTTADGTRLDADVWRPAEGGPYPVLLQRQAYGRRIGCTVCYAPPAWYASRGYIVVVQDIRGRGTSEGTFRPGEAEMADGAEAVEWAAGLDGSDGQVAMYGFSYQALNQILAAAGPSPSLKAVMPAMGPWDAAGDWAFSGGSLNLRAMIGWGLQITAEAARRAGDADGYARLRAAGLPVHGPVAARPAIVEDTRAIAHVADWVGRGPDDPLWRSISPAHHLERLRERALPMFFVGGWFDKYIAATWNAFAALARPGDPTTRLTIGPWLHFPWSRRVGGVDFGAEAAADMDGAQVAFLDQVLKGKGPRLSAGDRVRLFDTGSHAFLALADLPDGGVELYPAGTGRAAIDPSDGRLTRTPAAPSSEIVVSDPWRPAPGAPPGPVDRRESDTRGDVLTFESEAFARPMRLAGRVSARLAASADVESFDLSTTLSRVGTDGRVTPLASGYRHVRSRPNDPIEVAMTPAVATLAAGEALRLSIAGAAFPDHPVNPGTGADPAAATAVSALVSTIVVETGAPTFVRVPLVEVP